MAGAGRSRDDDKSNNLVQASNVALDWQNSRAYSRKISTPNLLSAKISMSFKAEAAVAAPIYDPLKFGGGLPTTQVIFWNIMSKSFRFPLPHSCSDGSFPKLNYNSPHLECIPIFKRKEHLEGRWKAVVFPSPNMDSTRDMPSATLHPSYTTRMGLLQGGWTGNDGFGSPLPSKSVESESDGSESR